MGLVEHGVVTAEMASPYVDDPEKRALLARHKAPVVPLREAVARRG